MSLKYIGKINLLIVEDDEFNLQLIRSFLEKNSDMNIISSTDGLHALNILELGKEDIDMVLLDLHLPTMQGKEVLHYIRKNRKFDNVPVIIISVDGMDEIELRNMGANDFILKPFFFDEFTQKIADNYQYRKSN